MTFLGVLYSLVIIGSIGTSAGFFCLFLYRLSQYVANLPGQRPRVVTRIPTVPPAETKPVQSEETRVCDACRIPFVGDTCPKCGRIFENKRATRRFQAFTNIRRKMEG